MKDFLRAITLSLLGVLMFTAICFAQGNVHGTVKDSAGRAVPFAIISLKSKQTKIISNFTTTDDKGVYKLIVPTGSVSDSLLVEVRIIGYISQAKNLTTKEQVDFVLQTSINQLEGVSIKSHRPFLRTSGDTLSYKVADFSTAQDRVIGDVIKKLPGVAVAADGTISYNGKNISNLYVGGDNLLDDKYNIATNTVPQGVVDQVQVIQNHQPIKMLQGKVTSEDVSLNLTIKKDAKLQLIGQESLAAGLPANYDVDLNAMMFKDKYKAINFFKGNNTGLNVQNDFVSHNLSSYLQRIDNDVPAALLPSGTVNTPNLAENRYLFDRSAAVSLNNLINIKKGEQLKVNINYVHDTQHREYQEQTKVYLPNDTVRYSESAKTRIRPDIIHGQFTLNINKDKYYLNDILITDYGRNKENSGLNTNGLAVNQTLKDNKFDFSNEFNLIQPLKSNNIIELYSYVTYISEPENRAIEPGFNPSKFNRGSPYSQLDQTVNIPTWLTNNYFSFKIPSNYFTQSYRAGLVLQSQKLESNLDVVQTNGIINPIPESSANRLNWKREKVYAEASYDIPGKILKASLTLPLSVQQISYYDNLYALNKSLTRLYFDPQIHIKYMVGVENSVTTLYSFRNVVGNIEDVYHGFILKDYRTLYANIADLTERKEQTAAIGFNYRKALTLFFWSLNVSYNHITANNITSSIISNSFQQRVILPFRNATNSWTANYYISKYSFALRTTFSGGVLWQINSSNQIQNNELLPYKTIGTNFNVGAETKVTSQITFSYKANLNQTNSHSSKDASSYQIKNLIQQAAISYNPNDNILFKLSGEHYITYENQTNDLKYFFADASMKFRVSKLKTDIELSAINFLNIKNYNSLYLSANLFTASTFTLPGRIVKLKFMFNI